MRIADIPQHIDKQLAKEKPFVIWRMPNAKNTQLLFQRNDTDYRFAKTGQSGFIASDFLQNNRYLIPESQSTAFSFPADHLVSQFTTPTTKKNSQPKANQSDYFKILDKAIHQLKSNQLQKVVLSHPLNIKSDEDVFTVFIKLLKNYPSAYIYLWYHPQTGIWLGATPETLIDIKNQKLTTMALAGTQTAESIDKVEWKAKEIQEQQYVVDAMTDSLKKHTTGLQISERKTVKAGELFHLQTDFQASIQNDQLLALLEEMHPTPAVCGIPRDKAKAFINQYENYQRCLYTGYLGYLNAENDRLETQLQVNLRCMQKNPKGYKLFVGGGITADSDPQQEWDETIAKAQTMLKAI
jgi:isochorismate synthase